MNNFCITSMPRIEMYLQDNVTGTRELKELR